MGAFLQDGGHLEPVAGEVVAIVDEEVAAIHRDEGAQAEVLKAEAQALVHVLARLGRLWVLQQEAYDAVALCDYWTDGLRICRSLDWACTPMAPFLPVCSTSCYICTIFD